MARKVNELKVLHSFGPYHAAVSAIAARRGTSEIFCVIDDSIHIIDIISCEAVEKISRAHAAPISAVSSCGHILVTTCYDGTLCLRSVKDRPSTIIAKVNVKPNGKSDVPDVLSCQIAINSAGQTLVAVSSGSEVYCIHVEKLLDHISKSNKSADQNIKLHPDFTTSHRLHSDRVSCLSFDDNGDFLLSAAEDGTVILIQIDALLPFSKTAIWDDNDDVDNNLKFGCLSLPEGVRHMALYGENSQSLLVTTDSEQPACYQWSISSEGDIIFVEMSALSPDLRSDETLRQGNISFNCISSILSKPNSIATRRLFALASCADGTRFLIQEFDESGHSSKNTFSYNSKGHTDVIRCACFGMNGVLITAGDDGVVCIWSNNNDSMAASDQLRFNDRCHPSHHKKTPLAAPY